MSNLLIPSIILVRPQMGENIGAAARAMANFGFTDLRLVAPRDGWPNDRAVDMASGAFEHMPEPQVFEDLAAASADLHHLYATTARRRDLVKPVYTPDAAVADGLAKAGRVGFVFGPERTGLENDDLSLCHSLITIPTSPDFSSLNLGQSVLLMAYAHMQATHNQAPRALPQGDSFPATHEDLVGFYSRLEDALDDSGFFKAANLKPTMIRNIRAIFSRAELTDQEVRTLHGVVSALIGKKSSSQ